MGQFVASLLMTMDGFDGNIDCQAFCHVERQRDIPALLDTRSGI